MFTDGECTFSDAKHTFTVDERMFCDGEHKTAGDKNSFQRL